MEAAFGEQDFATLERLAARDAPPPPDSDLARRVERAHDGARQLLQQAADAAGVPQLNLEVWPWRRGEVVFPFVWARFKHPSARAWAAHLGVFLSPDGCNCALDLEKDALDAGESRETLDEVLAFFRHDRAAALSELDDPDLRVWTDDDNVLSPASFLVADFDAFMAANRDRGHPWPRVGYRFAPGDARFAPDRQVATLGAWLDRLMPVYDDLLASCGFGA